MSSREYILGVDLGGTKIYTALANIRGEILGEVKIFTEAASGRDRVFDNIFKSIDYCLDKEGITKEQIKALGIGVPGPTNHAQGIVHVAPNLPGWRNVNVRNILMKRINTNIYVANDAQLAALAEAKYGAGRESDNFIYVTVGTGIGGAIVINRKLYTGSDGVAGEVGHMIIQAVKGRKNLATYYLEDLAAGTAIKCKFGFEANKLKELIKRKDAGAFKALDSIVDYLGIGMANLTTIFNPDLIIIGGGLSKLGRLLISPLQKKVREHAFSISKERIKVVRAKLRDRSGVLGAIALCLDN